MRTFGFVQADPIRAPARAQDLVLRHRVRDYRAGDIERAYPKLGIEEDFFVNYGFLSRDIHALMHPRVARKPWSKSREAMAHSILEFVEAQGVTHPSAVDAHFRHGRVRNWFGGSTRASTQLLDEMHYRGLVRIAGRERGVRLYAPRTPGEAVHDPHQALDRLVDVIVRKYAPLPERSLSELIGRLRNGVPQWMPECRPAFQRACERLPSAEIDGVRWYWPQGEAPQSKKWTSDSESCVRLLAPFDPVVWDRRRFEVFWNWSYRFEAYTPAAKRVRGYYALPLLWRDEIIGWGNLSVTGQKLKAQFGYVKGEPPTDRAFKRALADELQSIEQFLDLI